MGRFLGFGSYHAAASLDEQKREDKLVVGDVPIKAVDPTQKCAWDGYAEAALGEVSAALNSLQDVLAAFTDTVCNDSWASSGFYGAGEKASVAFDTVAKDFSGYFFDPVFVNNRNACLYDGKYLWKTVAALGSYMRDLGISASEEQARRVEAHDFMVKYEDWYWNHKAWEKRMDDSWTPDGIQDNDDPEPPKPEVLPVEKLTGGSLPVWENEEYSPQGRGDDGSRGVAGETSSAVPENLRAFGRWYEPVGEKLVSAVNRVSAAFTNGGFYTAPMSSNGEVVGLPAGPSSGWKWGRIPEQAVNALLGNVMNFHNANVNDALFLKTIADRFARAGGEGVLCTVSDSELSKALSNRGVEFSERTIKPVDDFGVMGVQPGAGFTVDPVNVATGGLTEHEIDSVFAGVSSSLVVERFYNAGDSVGGVFGSGFSSVLDEKLDAGLMGVTWRRYDGARLSFPVSVRGEARGVSANNGSWWCSRVGKDDVVGSLPELDSVSSLWLWVVSDSAGMRRVFDGSGQLVCVDTGMAGGLCLCRDEAGRVVRLVHSSGRYYDVFYNNDGRVEEIVDSAARRLAYTYDSTGRLTSVDGVNGVRFYEWDEIAGVIRSITDENGVVLCENTFSEDKRVATQKTPDGRTVRFDYLPSGSTIVTDASSLKENNDEGQALDERLDVWVWDSQARIVGVVDSHGSKMSITRDRFGNPVNVTDREGRTTRRVFDGRSRLVSEMTPEGVCRRFEWDQWDRPVKIVREIPLLSSSLRGESNASDEAISSPVSSVVEETILTYRDLEETNNVVVRTPVSVTDSEGVTYSFEHDEHGRVSALCGAGGYRLAFSYDEVTGDLVSMTNALGQTVSFTYDAIGNLASSTSPSGAVTRFECDNAGHVLKRIDPDGAVYGFVYENGRLVSQTAPDSGTTTYTYGENGKIVSVTDPLGRTTQFTHDDQGNTATITTPAGDTWQTIHDSMSRLTKILAPTGDAWAYGYTANGEIESVTNPTGLITSLSKTVFGGGTQLETTTSVLSRHCEERSNEAIPGPGSDIPAPVDSVDSSAASTNEVGQSQSNIVVLDGLGRPVRITSPDGVVLETRVYDKAGRVSEVLDGEAGLTRYEYNSLGLVSRIISPDETETVFTYDPASRLVKKSSSSGVVEEYSYDADGRVISIVNQDGNEKTFTYDVCGRLTSHTTTSLRGASKASDEAISGFITTTVSYSYDSCGRLASITDSVHGTRSFSYDLAGQLVSAKDANGNTTTYTYTLGGQVESVTAPDGGLTLFEYDCYGNLTKKTDPLGRSEKRSYNAAGKLTGLTRADNTGLSYGYDGAGRLLGIENHQGKMLASYDYNIPNRTLTITDNLADTEHSLVFDRLGRLTSKTTSDATIAYTYNKTGKRETMTIARAAGDQPTTVSYAYTPAGELEEVAHSTFGVIANALSRHCEEGGTPDVAISLGKAKQSRVERDEAGRISRIVTADSDVSYEYDAAGQLVRLTDNLTNQTTIYTYDSCGRLASITAPQGTTTFVYNQAGELVSRALPDGTTTTYTYDVCGRRVSETVNGDIAAQYEWDSLGYLARLARVDSEGTSEVFLSHDVFGNLNNLTTGDETTSFLWDTNLSIPALLQAGNMDVFTGLGHTAYGTPEHNTGWLSHGWRQTRPTNPANPWGLPPGIASFSSLRGASNATEAISSPSPWNILLGGSISVFGMELMGARAYDPSIHGFLSTDPLPPTLGTPYAGNPYEYAGNNPLALLDPLGLRALTDADIQQIAEDYKSANESWLDKYGAYIAGGVLIAGAAVAAIFVAPLTLSFGAMALVGAGISAASAGGFSLITQKSTKGHVDWDEFLVDTAIGGVFGLVTGGASTFIRPVTNIGKYASNIGLNVVDDVGGNVTAEWTKRNLDGKNIAGHQFVYSEDERDSYGRLIAQGIGSGMFTGSLGSMLSVTGNTVINVAAGVGGASVSTGVGAYSYNQLDLTPEARELIEQR